jgi:hypothetical protein
MNKLDLAGQTFGKWEVIREDRSTTQKDGKYHRLNWLCRCSCGNERLVSTNSLRSGTSTKCNECRHGRPNAAFNSIVKAYKESAKVRSLEYALSDEQVNSFVISNCVYCGSEPNQVRVVRGCRGSFTFNGIDRKDSSVGYTEDNCVACCKTCNYMKRSMSVEEFLLHIHKIAEMHRE